MSDTDKIIIETYTGLFEGLSPSNKIELIERLSKSLKTESDKKESAFFNSFGAFGSKKSAEEIMKEIKSNRRFMNKDIDF